MSAPQTSSWHWPPHAATHLASEWFGEPVAVTPLYGELDQNLKVQGTRPAVMKIMRDASLETIGLVELQVALLDHLCDSKVLCQHPRVIESQSGDKWRIVQDSQGREHVLWFLTYVEGQLLDDYTNYDESLLESIGAVVGAIDHALSDFTDPRADRDLLWDLSRVLELRSQVDTIREPEDRALLDDFFTDLEEPIQLLNRTRTRSVIHNDGGNQHNMIVRTTAGLKPQAWGLIDFGDALLCPRICGLGIASAYASFGTEDLTLALLHVARGYHRQLPLDSEDVALLPWLAGARWATTVIVAAQRQQQDPSDTYAMVSATPAWKCLRALNARGPSAVAAELESRLP